MTKVSIIEVDLGEKINDIISEGVEELTGAAQKELNDAIELAQQRDALRQQKTEAKKQATDAVGAVMMNAYERLETAGADGVPCESIMEMVSKHVNTKSAFSLRMKKILRDKGNPYMLEHKKRNGKNHYIFSPFNEPLPKSVPTTSDQD